MLAHVWVLPISYEPIFVRIRESGNSNVLASLCIALRGFPFISPPQKQRSPSTQTHNASDILSSGKSQPQTLEELLERQWEQGSQFLMEQASHFDSKSRVLLFL